MVTRRRMFSGMLGWGGAVLLADCGKKDKLSPEQSDATDSELSADNWTALQAAVERILPGANHAGAPAHLRYWLKTRQFAGVRREFKLGATIVDRLARSTHNQAFAACAPEHQDAILKIFEKGDIKERGFDSQGFFQRLLTLTVEGYLADPKYGGNRDQVGWRFIGYEPCWWAPRPK